MKAPARHWLGPAAQACRRTHERQGAELCSTLLPSTDQFQVQTDRKAEVQMDEKRCPLRRPQDSGTDTMAPA